MDAVDIFAISPACSVETEYCHFSNIDFPVNLLTKSEKNFRPFQQFTMTVCTRTLKKYKAKKFQNKKQEKTRGRNLDTSTERVTKPVTDGSKIIFELT